MISSELDECLGLTKLVEEGTDHQGKRQAQYYHIQTTIMRVIKWLKVFLDFVDGHQADDEE